MEKLKKKIFSVVFLLLTIFLISILFIFNYQSYNQEKKGIEDNLMRMEDEKDKNGQGNPGEIEKDVSSTIKKEPPAKPNENNNNNNNNNNGNSSNTVSTDKNNFSASPDGQQSNGKAPDMPNDNNNGGMQQQPNQNNNNNNSQQPNLNNNDNNNQQPKDMPDMKEQNGNSSKIRTIHYIMFGIVGIIISFLVVYLIMSKFNKLALQETILGTKKTIIFTLAVIILGAVLMLTQVFVTNKVFITESSEQNDQQMMPSGNMGGSSASVEKTGSIEIDGTTETLKDSYTTSEADKSVILVENSGNLTIDGATVSKTGGDSSNTENSEFYGVNSGILVTENSTATIKNATISTNAKGSNAVFSTGSNSKISISDSTITTTGSGSARGLDATYGGYIEADNVKIATQGGSCATLATDRGEGTVIANNSNLETNGSGSPVIYSTGNISITNTKETANGSQMVVIEGKNSATVTDSNLNASGKGNRGDTDQAGIMIYQSMSGDAGEGTGTFTAKKSTLTIQSNSEYYKTAPMFFVTNTDAVINLNSCKLSYGSNVLLSSKGTSEWGKDGSNGGNVTLNAEDQTLEGNIEIDKISTLTMNLSNSSYKGTINKDNTAKQITLKLDKNSSITLTGDSYITSLEDSDSSYSNINFNGYKLYVNGTAIN